ncbi:MAG: 2Fe-2S iron-sulfur cluster binding domain-containing protein, partial [Clostridia bacterium]|nr:2Fe-2S iron-sulfur cluster binding domain-containing protein [Clostridia bacterium]
MPVFYWNTQEKEYTLHFEGTPTVAELLREKGLPFSAPCGGKGTCGKCAIAINGNISAPDAREKALKTRLACRTVLFGDAWGSPLTEELSFASIESTDYLPSRGGSVPFAAVDLGTTTIVAKAFRADGTLIGEASALNPQREYAADV